MVFILILVLTLTVVLALFARVDTNTSRIADVNVSLASKHTTGSRPIAAITSGTIAIGDTTDWHACLSYCHEHRVSVVAVVATCMPSAPSISVTGVVATSIYISRIHTINISLTVVDAIAIGTVMYLSLTLPLIVSLPF